MMLHSMRPLLARAELEKRDVEDDVRYERAVDIKVDVFESLEFRKAFRDRGVAWCTVSQRWWDEQAASVTGTHSNDAFIEPRDHGTRPHSERQRIRVDTPAITSTRRPHCVLDSHVVTCLHGTTSIRSW